MDATNFKNRKNFHGLIQNLFSKALTFWVIIFFIISFSQKSLAQTSIPPAAGDGSPENPYQIASLENLYWIAESNTRWGFHYIQTANIDASPTEAWFDGTGWSPIGNLYNKFNGVYDGQGHYVSNLYINLSPPSYTGLFGYTFGAIIKNLGVTEVNMAGPGSSGAIVGSCTYSQIIDCYSSGSIHGANWNVGGLIGYSENSNIKRSYSEANVTGNERIGGCLGHARNSQIVECFFSGNVNPNNYPGNKLGGIVGHAYSSDIFNSFSIGNIGNSNCNIVGGIIGDLLTVMTINNSYAAGSVSGASFVGGLAGKSYGNCNIINSFWDIEQTGQVVSSCGGTGLTSLQMKTFKTFLDAGWDFLDEELNGEESIWGMDETGEDNQGYPFLALQNLNNRIRGIVSTQEVFVNNSIASTGNGTIIYLGSSPAHQYGVCWNTSGNPTILDNKTEEGVPETVGSFASQITGLTQGQVYYVRAYITNEFGTNYGEEVSFESLPFETFHPEGNGTLDNPFEIANLHHLLWLSVNYQHWDKHYIQTANIDASITPLWFDYAGWLPIGKSQLGFSGTYNGQGFYIDQLYINRLEDNIGLFSINRGTIMNLGVINADVSGNSNVGSVVGQNNGVVANCFSTGGVNGAENNTGGLVGSIISVESGTQAEVRNSYSRSNVNGLNYVGGLAGNGQNIEKSYSTGLVIGTGSNIGGLVGFGSASNSFWDIETSGQTTSGAGTGKTSAEMKTVATYTNLTTNGLSAPWDFVGNPNHDTNNEDHWNIDEVNNDGYPFLSWQIFATAPSVVTNPVSNITSYSATTNGSISEIGSPPASQHGFCWNTTGMPTVNDFKTELGQVSQPGAFSSPITDLITNTEYFVRAYATNEAGTAYGDQVQFTTKANYSLSVNITGSGTVYVNGEPYSQAIDFSEDTQVTLSAVAANGWLFDHWGGDINSTQPVVNVIISSNKSIDAIFTQNNTSISENEISGLVFFPNPFNSILHFQNSDKIIMVSVSNMLGNQVIDFEPKGKSSFSFSTVDWPQGLYFLKMVWVDGKITYGKVLKN